MKKLPIFIFVLFLLIPISFGVISGNLGSNSDWINDNYWSKDIAVIGNLSCFEGEMPVYSQVFNIWYCDDPVSELNTSIENNYLKLDGSNSPMTGNFNWGDYSIYNLNWLNTTNLAVSNAPVECASGYYMTRWNGTESVCVLDDDSFYLQNGTDAKFGYLNVTKNLNVTGDLSSANSGDWDTAYSHSQNNSQAHTDYLKNNADDSTTGKLAIGTSSSPLGIIDARGTGDTFFRINKDYGHLLFHNKDATNAYWGIAPRSSGNFDIAVQTTDPLSGFVASTKNIVSIATDGDTTIKGSLKGGDVTIGVNGGNDITIGGGDDVVFEFDSTDASDNLIFKQAGTTIMTLSGNGMDLDDFNINNYRITTDDGYFQIYDDYDNELVMDWDSDANTIEFIDGVITMEEKDGSGIMYADDYDYNSKIFDVELEGISAMEELRKQKDIIDENGNVQHINYSEQIATYHPEKVILKRVGTDAKGLEIYQNVIIPEHYSLSVSVMDNIMKKVLLEKDDEIQDLISRVNLLEDSICSVHVFGWCIIK